MTLNNSWIERNLYDSGGHTGNIYYIRIVRRQDSYVWDPINKAMKKESDIPWADSADELVEQGQTGVFPVVIAKEIPASTYDIIVYKQLGSGPASSDDIEKQWETKIGDIFGF